MTPMEYLQRAECVVRLHGDYNWFCEQYTRLREYYSVKLSAGAALADQGLLELMPADKELNNE